jgi:hypothetical protein
MSSLYDFLNTELSSSATGGVNTAEGQDPSTVNDGLRQFKQLVAAFIDDLGAVTTVGGTADAITVTLGQVGGANSISAYATGQLFRFKAGADNTGAATINVNAIGAKAIRKIESGADVALDAADILDGKYYLAIYDATANAAAGAWIIDPGSASVAAATTTAAGIVELATLAETLAYTDATRAVTPSNLPLPTGFLYGLTLANGTDATNDINIAAGSARDASDSYNFLLGSTYVKQIDAAWALGSAAGGLDTGSVGNSRYAIWGIGRSDTRVCDVLFSLSFSAPTMPANYDFKVLIGEFTRTGGVNGTPKWYGRKVNSDTYALAGPHVILEDQKAQNTAGGTFTSGADQTRVLNTEVYDPYGLCALSSNQFTLGAGTWYARWSAPAFNVGRHQSWLYNVTDTSVVGRATSDNVGSSSASLSSGGYVFTITASKAFEIRHRCQVTAATNGFGVEGNFGTEIYTRVEITKVA